MIHREYAWFDINSLLQQEFAIHFCYTKPSHLRSSIALPNYTLTYFFRDLKIEHIIAVGSLWKIFSSHSTFFSASLLSCTKPKHDDNEALSVCALVYSFALTYDPIQMQLNWVLKLKEKNETFRLKLGWIFFKHIS